MQGRKGTRFMLKDNVILDGFVITPQLLEQLKCFYSDKMEPTPERYVRYLSLVQDIITRNYLDDRENQTLFNCVDTILMIKDHFSELTADKVGYTEEMIEQINESWNKSIVNN